MTRQDRALVARLARAFPGRPDEELALVWNELVKLPAANRPAIVEELSRSNTLNPLAVRRLGCVKCSGTGMVSSDRRVVLRGRATVIPVATECSCRVGEPRITTQNASVSEAVPVPRVSWEGLTAKSA